MSEDGITERDASPTGEAQPEVRIGPWLRRSRRTAYQNAWLTIYHDEVDRPDGAPGIYGVVHFANLAVGVVAVDGDDRVPLVGQWRYPLDEESWEIPEGGVPLGESAEEGARRELREETGLEAERWREIGRYRLSNSVTDETTVLFAADGLRGGTPDPEGTEQLTIRWVPFNEVLEMTLDGRINDALTALAIWRLALERARRPQGGIRL